MNVRRIIQIGMLMIVSGLSMINHAKAQEKPATPDKPAAVSDTSKFGNFNQLTGFKLFDSKYGDVNFRLFTYIRYLNQSGLSSIYTNAFGKTYPIDKRQDIQMQKVTLYFSGWFVDPKFRYFIFVWSNNASQGLGAQVVIAGNVSYNFNKHVSLLVGIMSLPGVRSTEGNFPYWLPVDNRMMSDEYFRPSYTTGLQAKGEIVKKLNYVVMLGNNLSQLGIDAGQLDDQLNTLAAGLIYYPTTGEFGLLGGSFGDYEDHQKVATRLAAHFTRSNEDRQGQPQSDAFDNTQIRISDGSVIFAPNLFSTGTQVDKVRYKMTCFDAGVKYHGFAFEGEYYWRWLDDFSVSGIPLTFNELRDNGFQFMGSAMIMPRFLQIYSTYAAVYGGYGNSWEFRTGLNINPFKTRSVRFNAQYIYEYRCPTGGTAVPYQVGATGSIFNIDLELNF